MEMTTLIFIVAIVTANVLGLVVGALFMHCIEVHYAKFKRPTTSTYD